MQKLIDRREKKKSLWWWNYLDNSAQQSSFSGFDCIRLDRFSREGKNYYSSLVESGFDRTSELSDSATLTGAGYISSKRNSITAGALLPANFRENFGIANRSTVLSLLLLYTTKCRGVAHKLSATPVDTLPRQSRISRIRVREDIHRFSNFKTILSIWDKVREVKIIILRNK